MNETIAQRLTQILKHNGPSLLDDRMSMQRLLAPGQAAAPPEVQALLMMLDTGAVKHLLKWARTREPDKPSFEQMCAHMASKFEQAGKLDASMAHWALHAWGQALEEVKQANVATQALSKLSLQAMEPAPEKAEPAIAHGATSPERAAPNPASAQANANPYAPPRASVADVAPSMGDQEGSFVRGGRALSAGRGAHWLKEGWRLFAAHPIIWWACLLVIGVTSMLLQMIPILGPVLSGFLNPILFAGLMLGAHAVSQGETLTVAHSFAGFSARPGRLALLTLISTAMMIVVVGIIVLLFGSSLMATAQAFVAASNGAPGAAAPSLMGLLFGSVGAAFVLFCLLILPLTAAFYFAVPLIAVGKQGIVASLKMSFWACLKNVLPFLVYGLWLILLGFIATLPIMLGWLVLIPVLITSTYAAYRDIFYEEALGA